MKGTKLWQEAGSPIIRGRSRRQRPFWQPFLVGALATFGFAFAAGALGWASTGFAAPSRLGALADALAVTAVVLPGAIVGAALGVWIARTSAWRNEWVFGLLGGLAVGAVSALLLSGSLVIWGVRLR